MADVAAAPASAPAAAPAAAAATPAPVGEAPLAKLPDKLQNLTRPVVVSGTVVGETAEGLTRVRTAAGEVLLKSPVPLATDKLVTLQIPAGSPPAKAMVLATALATATAAPPAAAGQTAAPPQIGAGQTLLQSIASAAASAVAAQPAQMLTAGSLLSAVVLAANPRPAGAPAATVPTAGQAPTATAAPGGKTAPASDGGGKDGAAASGAKPATDGPAAAPLSRSGTQGQPVELGGDAAHRGSQLAPPPQTSQPAASQTTQPSAPQQSAPQQPAPQQAPGKPPNGEAPPQPQQQQTAQQPPAPRPPQPTAQAAPETAQTAQPQTTTTPPRSPTVGLSGPSFGAPPPAPTAAAPSPTTTAATTTAAAPSEPAANTPTPAPAPTPTSTPAPAPEAAPPPVLRTGQVLALKVVAVTLPGDSAAAPPASASSAAADTDGGALLEGEVAGTTPQGKPIVALRDGMLALNTDRALPPGSKLTLQIADPAAVGGGLAAQATEDLPDYLQTRDWPALKQALGALRDIDPALVHNFLAAAMPQPNRKLGAALTFLISAMRGGDARGWLGADATNALRDNGKESLLRGLEREFQAKEQQAAEKLPDEWRGVTLPFYDQTGLHPLHLHVRPFPDDDESAADKGGGPKGSRFVLDVELSRLGPLQLDGMVKPPRFDLILRSNAPLDPGLRQELRDIFARCLDAVGYGGGVSFQADTRGWVRLSRAGSSAPAVTA